MLNQWMLTVPESDKVGFLYYLDRGVTVTAVIGMLVFKGINRAEQVLCLTEDYVVSCVVL